MKIVLSIPTCVIHESEQRRLFAHSLAQLVADGHHVTVILARPIEPMEEDKRAAIPHNGTGTLQGRNADSGTFSAVANAGRTLSAQLAFFKTCGIFLYGSDAGICRIRKSDVNGTQSAQVEICEIDPHWIHIICSNGGVPILSSTVLSAWGEYYTIDPDEQAAACAIQLDADLLLYLTLTEEVTDSCGTVLRWLAVEDIEKLSAQQKDIHAVSRLNLCRRVLESGVRRVRMLPVSQIEYLAAFYQRKIDHGTEVIMQHSENRRRLLPGHTAAKQSCIRAATSGTQCA